MDKMASHNTTATLPRKLWDHPDPESTAMWKFMQQVNKRHNMELKTFRELYAYSIAHRSDFWAHVFDASSFIHSGTRPAVVVDESAPIDLVPTWFPGVTLNYAENMLFSSPLAGHTSTFATTRGKEDHKIAVTSVREASRVPFSKEGERSADADADDADETRHVSYGELRRLAGRLAGAMAARGVLRGDRIVAVGAPSVEILLVWLASAWLGAVFSSSATDMGVRGILQRAVQVDPKLLFMDDAAVYNGRRLDLTAKMAEVGDGLAAGCRSFSGVVAMPRSADPGKRATRERLARAGVPRCHTWDGFLSAIPAVGAAPPAFVRVPFHHPVLICYSSGTTGQPKAIVHSTGGLMLNYFKEGALHEGLGADSVTMQYTTAGWIMFVAATTCLLLGARTVLYDGSPFRPDAGALVRLAARERATKLGISPRWLQELCDQGISPREVADLSALRTVTSTGMVLSDRLFEWFYDAAFPPAVQLANISGGTDIAGCFGLLNPLEPVYVGGTQGPSLGVPVAIYDALLPGGPGREVSPPGEPGELVALAAFPNMPCYFWGDHDGEKSSSQSQDPARRRGGPAPPGSRYHAAYFARFDHVWAHGDFCSVHPLTGGIAFLGRADGVLNPSGVRFGSAEIYAVLEKPLFTLARGVADALCVGRRRPGRDADESVMLFVLMRPGAPPFDRALAREIREAIGRDLSKRHVPRFIFETPEIPTTINGKKVELPVKQIVSGQKIKASGTLANPKSLDFYYQFAEVEDDKTLEPKAKL